MDKLSFRQRRRRHQQAALDVEASLKRIAEDPGLRERYRELPRAPIRLIVAPMGKFINQGGILRLAEAFRLERVDYAREADDYTDLSGGTGIWRWQPYRWISVHDAIDEARSQDYRIYALTLDSEAIPVSSVQWKFPCALVLGEEKEGLAQEIVERCDESIAIPLFGLVGSLNVASACAIAVHSAMNQYCQLHDFEPARQVSRDLLDSGR
jgi:tRNA (guanosine-2'-O-)-methyltransferase